MFGKKTKPARPVEGAKRVCSEFDGTRWRARLEEYTGMGWLYYGWTLYGSSREEAVGAVKAAFEESERDKAARLASYRCEEL